MTPLTGEMQRIHRRDIENRLAYLDGRQGASALTLKEMSERNKLNLVLNAMNEDFSDLLLNKDFYSDEGDLSQVSFDDFVYYMV
jgi:hypothetical protein